MKSEEKKSGCLIIKIIYRIQMTEKANFWYTSLHFSEHNEMKYLCKKASNLGAIENNKIWVPKKLYKKTLLTTFVADSQYTTLLRPN